MKTLNVLSVYFQDESDLKTISQFLDKNFRYNSIDLVSWPNSYPYQPDAKFIIVRSPSSLFIKFKVSEMNLKAVYTIDQEPVYEDSCVEFFCKTPESRTYMNFEFNCIGTCIATTRGSKTENIIPFSESDMKKILRYSSLESNPFNEKKGIYDWELTVKIPLEIISMPFPESLLANFYKCADETKTPHFLSWNPIYTSEPDFHRPEFFGGLIL